MKVLGIVLLLLGAVPQLSAAPESARAIIDLLNSRSSGSVKGYADAAEVVAADAAKGKPLQQFVIALVSEEMNAPKVARLTPEKRKAYLDSSRGKIKALAEKRGNALAWYLLSLENGDETMLQRAADGDNVQALNAWGSLIANRAMSDRTMLPEVRELTFKRSFDYFRRAANMDDANGLFNLGTCYKRGLGCEKDEVKAFACFKRAANMGHPEALNNLAGCYRDGVSVAVDLGAATRYFAKSAELGNPFGELNYALALSRGEGIEKDEKLAFRYFRRAARQGLPLALNAFAMCYFHGKGVEKDDALALKYLRLAAEYGAPQAMENLATFYDKGLGGLEKDEKMALVWKVRAHAARGSREAQAWLNKNGY